MTTRIWTLLAAAAVAVVTIVDEGICKTLSPAEGSHVVQIGQKLANGKIEPVCGGSYIGKNVVVLGAHCFNRNGNAPDTVRFRNAYGGSTDLRISNFTLHYRYKTQFDYHNMAVAFLDRDPRTAINTVKPACVLKPHIKGNKSVQLIGLIGNQLDRVDLQTVSSEKCHEYYNPNRKLRFGVLLCCFCARNANLKNCTDQHSAPLQAIVVRSGKQVPFLIGHKSIGRSCGTNTPAVYTRYGSYYEWLETVTGISLDEKDCINRY
ncbi:serine protease snake [Culex quinquefasciatus]|uniref:serine protease snake n=1 Tax=Culex quinquefasciatus TaxID=7176 RepID=UPI0018E3A035|nr:serine protease snake [Culex quinquefasciatus]